MRRAIFLSAAILLCLFPQSAEAQEAVRVGGAVKEPSLIKRVEPRYPTIALQASVSGTVILEAHIGKDGSVTDVRVLRPIALLTEAAVEAVRQWRYSPTLLNGVPVEVLMAVTVRFEADEVGRPTGAAPGAQVAGAGAEIDSLLDQVKSLRQQQRIAEAEQMLERALVELRKERAMLEAITAGVTPAGAAPVRVGGAIKEPILLKHVDPVYPTVAQQAGVQGTVILEAIIDASGEVRSAKVLRSIPLLDQAALEAISQRRYTPTLLNGVPVEVIMTVTVNFTLK